MILQIDKYFFDVKHNISGLSKKLNVNLDKQNTLTKPVYTHMGGYEENISFEATILLKDLWQFDDFEELVKGAKPLKIRAFDLVEYKHIFITELEQSVGNFVKGWLFGTEYYTKTIKISGVILDESYDPGFIDTVVGLLT